MGERRESANVDRVVLMGGLGDDDDDGREGEGGERSD